MNAEIIWNTAVLITVLSSLPGTIEILVLSVSALRPMRASVRAGEVPPLHLAVIVPAHNEEKGILKCLANLKECIGDDERVSIVVVADNCTDLTVDRALATGVRVLIRNDQTHLGKGYALDYAFRSLLIEDFDGFLVIDADTRVQANLIPEFRRALATGADAAQCNYLVANPEVSTRTRLMHIAWLAFNLLRLRGRERIGCSVGILGNGFALSRETLRSVPYDADSIAEDLEYHLRLVQAGKRVRYIGTTTVWSAAPEAGQSAATQRSRWEGGRFRMIAEQIPVLLPSVLRGHLRLIEPLFELLLLPLAYHVTLLLAAFMLPVDAARCYALFGLSVVAFHVLVAIKVGNGGWRDLAALVSVPFYILWKLALVKKLIKSARKDADWIRTERA